MRRPNQVLAEHMARAGMRPPRLVAEINALLGDGYVSRSTVSEWLHAGRIPREPLPALIAALLSDATGSHIRVSDLWPGTCLAPTWAVPADDGLDRIAQAPSPAIELARDWVTYAAPDSGRDRRQLIPVPSGRHDRPTYRLTGACRSQPWTAAASDTAAHFAALPGLPAALRYVHRQVVAFCRVLLEEGHDLDTGQALSVVTDAAAETVHDAGQPGLAQRYRASARLLLHAKKSLAQNLRSP